MGVRAATAVADERNAAAWRETDESTEVRANLHKAGDTRACEARKKSGRSG